MEQKVFCKTYFPDVSPVLSQRHVQFSLGHPDLRPNYNSTGKGRPIRKLCPQKIFILLESIAVDD